MSDRLLAHYNQELEALRRLAGEFAEAHPGAAGRLRMTGSATDDPHVERLLEGVAFLSARTQARLDDELPEITDALLETLYPHYLAPVPSAAIVQFACKPELRTPLTIARDTMLETDPIAGEPCRFRTTQDTTLWPLDIENVRLSGLPLAAPAANTISGARSVLRIALSLADPEAQLASFDLSTLRFHLRGSSEVTHRLYELLCGHALAVALADGPNDDRPTMLPAHVIQAGGFSPDEALIPWDARSAPGLRFLTEYAALPAKFLFVDIGGLEARTLVQESRRLEIFVYFDISVPSLERSLTTQALALGCTPVINLFRRGCEPIRLDGRATEYEVVADNRRPDALEIWRLERVREMRGDGTMRPWIAFYRHRSITGLDAAGQYLAIRRDSTGRRGGTDMLFAPAALPGGDRHADPAETVLSIDALCTNRDLPARLPFGDGKPALRLSDGPGSIAAVRCLTPPSAALRPPLREGRNWRLISHLSLGHLSLVERDTAAATLREVLRLYDVNETPQSRSAIEALVGVQAREATARVPGARQGSFCRGVEVTLEFEPQVWESAGLFLLASVLERFLALQATVNSFVRTRAVLRGRPGSVAAFPPRAGDRTLI